MSEKLETLRKKLLYRASYRGTKEMDILLGSFVKRYVNKFDFELLKELDAFLSFEDEIILNFYNFNISKKNIDKNRVSEIFKDFKV